MNNNSIKVLPIEKIISVLSYLTMGIVGVLWIIIGYISKKNLRYFLMYNICQSMIISVFLAIFKLLFDIIMSLLSVVHILDYVTAIFNYLITIKIIRIYPLGISFTILELAVFIFLIYICIGIVFGRIFYIPLLTNFMKKVMNNYS